MWLKKYAFKENMQLYTTRLKLRSPPSVAKLW